MSDFYLDLKAVADDLISQFGRSAVLKKTHIDSSHYDPVIEPSSNTPINIVQTKFRIESQDKDDIKINSNDLMILMSSPDEPKIGDVISDSGNDYKIIFSDNLSPGEVTLLYKVAARR